MTVQTKKISDEKVSLLLGGTLEREASGTLREALEKACEAYKEIELDMKETEGIGSACLRELMLLSKRAEQEKKALSVTNVSSKVMAELEQVGFDRFLVIL